MTEQNLIPEFNQAKWADYTKGQLKINKGILPIQMKHSDGTGLPLVAYKNFGADVVRFPAGKGVGTHTHIGAHILIVLEGEGFVEYEGVDHPLQPGIVYMIPGNIKHAIKATTELILIAVGNDHRPLDSEERLHVVK